MTRTPPKLEPQRPRSRKASKLEVRLAREHRVEQLQGRLLGAVTLVPVRHKGLTRPVAHALRSRCTVNFWSSVYCLLLKAKATKRIGHGAFLGSYPSPKGPGRGETQYLPAENAHGS